MRKSFAALPILSIIKGGTLFLLRWFKTCIKLFRKYNSSDGSKSDLHSNIPLLKFI
ncbi:MULTISPECIES: hypothetical protein [Flavobacteriaceae]|uniref:Uncharacterized protein n=1 Tax=Lutibacter litoralis TaxID=321268 RepID=A0ABV5JWD7_9FLAO|nr:MULTISPECIES: hypothetical protein [Flavobacteriaceae]